MSTSATPDTAVSPTLDTITVSTMPTSITNTCSITNGTNSFFKSLSENNTSIRLDFWICHAI